jgi:WD40 repeat protein
MGAVQLCTQHGEPIELLATRTTETRKVLFSPDGQFLATSFSNGLISVWTPKGELVAQLHCQRRAITDGAFSPDARILAAGDVRLWETRAWRLLARFHGVPNHHAQSANVDRSGVTDLAFVADGSRLILHVEEGRYEARDNAWDIDRTS